MAVLLNRVKFTEMIEEGFKGGDLSSVQKGIQAKRTAIIAALRTDMPNADRRQRHTLQTLFKEHLDVISEMIAGDAASIWKQEMRFYPQPDGTVTCKCGDYETMVGDNGWQMLVCTPLSRQARTKMFEAMKTDKIYAAWGPAGTGKTETIKDTFRMLNIESCVVNSSDQLTEVPVECYEKCKPHGRSCPMIFDEFNRIGSESMDRIIKGATAQTFTCTTFNPGYSGRTKIPDSIKALCVEQEYTIPDFKLIAQVMMGSEGIIDCDSLGAKLTSVFAACKEKCSKQHWYDFGLRAIKSTTKDIGQAGRKNGFDNETKLVADCLGLSFYTKLNAEDKKIGMDTIKEAFGIDAEVPEEFKAGTVESVAKMVEAVQRSRHGICVVGATDIDATIAAIDSASKSESIIVEGDETKFYTPNGAFVVAYKAAMTKTSLVNICVKTPVNESSLVALHTLLDDNKKLCLSTGEVLEMTPHMRVIVFDKDCSMFSPASVSRFGCVWAAGGSRKRKAC